MTGISGFGSTLLYLLMALLYFFPVLYMYRFSWRMKTALLTKSTELELNLAFKNLKANLPFYWHPVHCYAKHLCACATFCFSVARSVFSN